MVRLTRKLNLRRQLLLVSLVLLALPWVGCEFLAGNELALRKAQEISLAARAETIAQGLKNRRDLLYTSKERFFEPPSKYSLYAEYLAAPAVVDGYVSDWTDIPTRTFTIGDESLELQLGVADDRLYVAARARLLKTAFHNPSLGSSPNGDRIEITTWQQNRRQVYTLSTEAPGKVRATIVGRKLPGVVPERIRGVWLDSPKGHQIEFSMPLEVVGERLGINFIGTAGGSLVSLGNLDTLNTAAPPPLIRTTESLNTYFKKFGSPDLSLAIRDRWGWTLVSSDPHPISTVTVDKPLLRWLYRIMVDDPAPPKTPTANADGRSNQSEVYSAVRGQPSVQYYRAEDGVLVSVAVPINSDDGVMGSVTVTQQRDQFLALTDAAFADLLRNTIIALILVLGVLIAYAGLTSLRIQRLSNALKAETVSKLPKHSLFNDEIDDLKQAFEQFMDEQYQYQDYLRNLTRMLAHELRTPIAVINSSLENLELATGDEAERAVLQHRAKTGLFRLRKMLDAMNEASRLEQSMDAEDQERIDLVRLVNDLTGAYSGTFVDFKFKADYNVDTAMIQGYPDQLVQALDKLVENAASFAEKGSTITLGLHAQGLWWWLSVSNTGPTVPEEIQKNLFSPLASHRENKGESSDSHMGLGLYIMKLVAEHHKGEPFIQNLDDGSGVRIGFSLVDLSVTNS